MSSPLARRRGALAASAMVTAVALLLTGCSGGADAGGPASAREALLPAAEGVTDYPLTLDTPFGETVLDERPERIAVVTASTVDTDALLALGGTPVFAPSTLERNVWVDPAVVSGIEKLWTSEAGAEVSAESVAAIAPDLIVALDAYDTFDQSRFDQLSAIAPVLYAESGALTWQELTERLGDAVDLGETAERTVAAAEERVAAAREAHPEFSGRTAAHVIVYDQEWGASYVSAPGTDTAALFEKLGFTLPPDAARFVGDDAISDELVGLIDADFLLVSTFEQGSDSYFVDSPLFQAVPAVAAGRVVFNPGNQQTGINEFAWGLNVQSALSVPWLIDRLVDLGEQAIG